MPARRFVAAILTAAFKSTPVGDASWHDSREPICMQKHDSIPVNWVNRIIGPDTRFGSRLLSRFDKVDGE